VTEPPILSAKEMAEFAMRESHLDSYRRHLLVHIEMVNGKPYATEVRNLMVEMLKKQKGKK
jgi:hypothetical protein